MRLTFRADALIAVKLAQRGNAADTIRAELLRRSDRAVFTHHLLDTNAEHWLRKGEIMWSLSKDDARRHAVRYLAVAVASVSTAFWEGIVADAFSSSISWTVFIPATFFLALVAAVSGVGFYRFAREYWGLVRDGYDADVLHYWETMGSAVFVVGERNAYMHYGPGRPVAVTPIEDFRAGRVPEIRRLVERTLIECEDLAHHARYLAALAGETPPECEPRKEDADARPV